MTALMQVEGVSKTYGGVRALGHVDFRVEAGAVNVLIGENGAGKSTLMRILAGVERPDDGRILLDGQPISFGSARDAARAGVSIVFQELNLCPNLSILDNIFLSRGGARIDRRGERETARRILERLEHPLNLDAPVDSLPIGRRQIVEIAKALATETRVLILDEPTSSLSSAEVDVLFRVVGELKAAGVAIVYISHRLDELMRIGDVVTVLRDGRLQARADIADVTIPWIMEQMLGSRTGEAAPQVAKAMGDAILSVRGLTLERPGGRPLLENVSLDCRAGEIIAVYGLLGSGRSELLETLAGARRPASGAIIMLGEDVTGQDVAGRVRRRIGLVPEDRQRDGLFSNLSVGENIAAVCMSAFTRFGVIDKARMAARVDEMLRRLGVVAASADAAMTSLSGGNQQKVLIGRQLMADPAVLLLDEPGRGVDVGARAEIFAGIRALSEQGLGVIFATSEMVEARGFSDRVLVMADGRITAEFPAAAATDEALVNAANPAPDVNDNAPVMDRSRAS